MAAHAADSKVGDTVTNPVTGKDTTVSALIVDPASTPTAGTTAFVQTADGYVFLVKAAGETIYNSDNPPVAFEIVSISGTTAQISSPGASGTASLSTQLTRAQYDSDFSGADTPGAVTPPDDISGPNGVKQVAYGDDGSNGRDGALVVPPRSGGDGKTGPTQTKTLSSDVNATSNIGWEVGSVGGDGGQGGDSYLSFFDGRDGGDGGKGGTVYATQANTSTITTSGKDDSGIFAYSRSGEAGDGGSGFAALGGGTGGHSADGGNVNVTQRGEISTTGQNAHGIYALSVSNNGGRGGSQWGLVGSSGDGGFGGNGGDVDVTTVAGATILTQESYSHGIYAQSVGGTGGSAGTSGNLLVSLIGSADNGGNGGEVEVTHGGAIETRGDFARGIVAQSVGGGGGSGGTGGGLVSLSLGGVGSNGGSGDEVEVTVQGTGSILTAGIGADGILAQSIGGSGGTGANSYGLVAVGGTGSKGGTGDKVTVRNYGRITTQEAGARGIVAQSIGGGGGDGGSSAGMVSVGGSGSGGGAGHTVTILNDGIITTGGDDATGILAQSIGGGGGNGGSSGSVGLFASVAIGGDGGSGGKGGNVSVTLSDTDSSQPSAIQTSGARSAGPAAAAVTAVQSRWRAAARPRFRRAETIRPASCCNRLAAVAAMVAMPSRSRHRVVRFRARWRWASAATAARAARAARFGSGVSTAAAQGRPPGLRARSLPPAIARQGCCSSRSVAVAAMAAWQWRLLRGPRPCFPEMSRLGSADRRALAAMAGGCRFIPRRM